MKSIFSKLAVAAFITIGFLTQETQSVQIRNLVQAQRQEVNSNSTLFTEVLLGNVALPGSTTTAPSKEASKVTSAPSIMQGPAPKASTTTTTTPVAIPQPAKATTTLPKVSAGPVQTAPIKAQAQDPPAKTTTPPAAPTMRTK